jgi:hypothetical protein
LNTNKFRFALAIAAVGAATLTACGDDENGGEEAEQASATPQDAITEIAAVRTGLASAVTAYRADDADRAQMLVEDAYLEHFELVEPALEEVDPELNEELEEQIREELVGEIEAGAPTPDVVELTVEIQRGLTKAESALEGAG